MTQMTEREVLTAMQLTGLGSGIEAVCALLVSLGYHDVARELQLRFDECSGFDEDFGT